MIGYKPVTFGYASAAVASQPAQAGVQAKPAAAPSVMFGACVAETLKKEQFQQLMLNNSWAERLHAIASVGGNGKEEIVNALSSYILRQEGMNRAPLSDDVIKFSVLAMTESTLKNKALKEKVLQTLEQAKRARHLRSQKAMIEEAIAKIQHDGRQDSSQQWREAEQEYVRNRHGNAFGQGGQAHH